MSLRRPVPCGAGAMLAAWLCLAAAAAAAAPTLRPAPRVMVLTQTVSADAQPVVSFDLRIAPVAFHAGALAGDRQAQVPVHVAAPASVVPLPDANGLTRSQLLARAAAWLAPQAVRLAADLGADLRARGLAWATFMLDQRVLPADGSAPLHLVWTVLLDGNGRALYGDPAVQDQDPRLLYVRYVPRAVAAGLPAQWAYPGAGVLSWQLTDAGLHPLGAATQRDVAGAFDAPQGTAGPVDPDAGLRCLVDHAAGPACPPALPDVRTLLDTTGAAAAVLDYVRSVAPVYDAVGTGGVQQARAALRIDLRRVDYSACDVVRFTVAGTAGFELARVVDRYVVAAGGSYGAVNRFSATDLSPSAPFQQTVTVARDAVQTLDQYLLEPGGERLVAVNDVAGLTYLAPLTLAGSPTGVLARAQSPGTAASLQCQANGTLLAAAWIQPAHRVLQGPLNSSYAPVQASFLPGQPATLAGYAATTYDGRPWERITLAYDGGNVLTVTTDDLCQRTQCQDNIGGTQCWSVPVACPSVLQLRF